MKRTARLGLELSLLLLLLLLLLLFTASAHDEGHTHCGTKSPSRKDKALNMGRMHHYLKQNRHGRQMVGESCDELCLQCIEIPTYFHFLGIPVRDDVTILPHPTETLYRVAVEGDSSAITDFTSYEEMLTIVDQQMEVLNARYAETPFRFKLVDRDSTSLTGRVEWTDWVFDYAADMSAVLGRGGLESLNVYLSYAINSEIEGFPDSVVGFGNFPSYQFDKAGDGVFIRYDTLVNGGLEGSDTGLTLVHEVGHWFGLLHVFENALEFDDPGADPCHRDNFNDNVDDTPVMAGATQDLFPDCKEFLTDGATLPDTCPNQEGNDPIFNYMNYLEDETCFLEEGEFTCGQIERMYLQWLLYREEVDLCESDEIMFELVVHFDKFFHAVENSFSLISSGGDLIYDSERDHEEDFVIDLQDTLVVDLCIPKDTYLFVFDDTVGDGLEQGSIEVYVNNKMGCKIEGDFGKRARIGFNDEEMECPGEAVGPRDTPTKAPTDQGNTGEPKPRPPSSNGRRIIRKASVAICFVAGVILLL